MPKRPAGRPRGNRRMGHAIVHEHEFASRARDAGESDSVLGEQCPASRASFRVPEHVHICTALVGDHCETVGHVCACGDWWHD